MSRLTKLVLVLTTLLLFSFTALAVNAVTVVIGNNNDLSRYPFGRDPGAASSAFPDFAAGGAYQQVYASSAFAGPLTATITANDRFDLIINIAPFIYNPANGNLLLVERAERA